MRKIFALLIALLAWAGLAIQFSATPANSGSVGETLWILARYFTVLTNLLVAGTFTMMAAGRLVAPAWLGGVTIAIVLVGTVYMLLLRGLVELSGGAALADILLHMVVPPAVALYWLLLAPHGALRRRDPWWWSLYPLAYFAYAMMRGMAEDRYAYPFINLGELGLALVVRNAVLIAGGFVLAGLGMVALDHVMGRRPVDRPQR